MDRLKTLLPEEKFALLKTEIQKQFDAILDEVSAKL